MWKGIFFALSACMVWGLIFVVPQFMIEFTAIEVALGRYVCYGTFSVMLFAERRLQKKCEHSFSTWKKALVFSLSTVLYYIAVVFSVRYSDPAVCALILGISPIAIAYLGNWQAGERNFISLIIPSLFIILGLSLIHAPHLSTGMISFEYLVGLVGGFVALSLWCWYVVANASFLKDQAQVSSNDWTTLIGVTSLFWVVAIGAVLLVAFPGELEWEHYYTLDESLARFIIGSAILGLVCSWLGAFCWNRASVYLPVSLAGQLTIFETIFGLLFAYLVAAKFPPLLEFVGIFLLLSAVVYGIRQVHAEVDPDLT